MHISELLQRSGTTASEQAVVRLCHDILSGTLTPDTKLKIRDLTELYGIGASPMREALAQLTATGMVNQEGQRGFRVSPVSMDELQDITLTRQLIEAHALRLAIEHGDMAWEDEIVASYHLFVREIIRFYDSDDKRLDVYEERHHRFHQALISACPLNMLKGFCDDLYVQKTRYRRITRSYPFDKSVVIAEHRTLMEAVLRRDTDKAVSAIQNHIGLTAELILGFMRSGKRPSRVVRRPQRARRRLPTQQSRHKGREK